MKKFSHVLLVSTALGMAACGGNQNGYTVTGTIDGAAEGDTVLLQEVVNRRDFTDLDTAFIKNGEFTFKGTQDTVASRFLTWIKNGEPAGRVNFYLENGTIKANMLGGENESITGTVSNDAYQAIRNYMGEFDKKAEPIIKAINSPEIDQETREAKIQEIQALEKEYTIALEKSMRENITNVVGVDLFKQMYYNLSTEQADSLIQQMSAVFQNDETIVRIKEMIEKQKQTAVGKKFVDFEMQTPEGKSVKLSDYVGKGKVVLIDFWASWCGPCRQEMPNIVKAYQEYKDKNFEIVGVSLDRDGESWKQAIKDLNITWPQMSDLKFWNSLGAQTYAVNSIPHTILVDGEGTIIARGLHGDELLDKLAEVLK